MSYGPGQKITITIPKKDQIRIQDAAASFGLPVPTLLRNLALNLLSQPHFVQVCLAHGLPKPEPGHEGSAR